MNNLQASIPYQAGYKAYWDYKTQEDNPYKFYETTRELWLKGFTDARAVDNGDEVSDEEFHKLLGIV